MCSTDAGASKAVVLPEKAGCLPESQWASDTLATVEVERVGDVAPAVQPAVRAQRPARVNATNCRLLRLETVKCTAQVWQTLAASGTTACGAAHRDEARKLFR
ncbi:hypothetical protein GCM10027579_20550 [Calidifontibacter terrae]